MHKSAKEICVITEGVWLKSNDSFFVPFDQNAERRVFISRDKIPEHTWPHKNTPFLDDNGMESSAFIVGPDSISDEFIPLMILTHAGQIVKEALDGLKVLWKIEVASSVNSKVERFKDILTITEIGFDRIESSNLIQYTFRGGDLVRSKGFVYVPDNDGDLIGAELVFFIIRETSHILWRAFHGKEERLRKKAIVIFLYPNHVKEPRTVIFAQLNLARIQQVFQTIYTLVKVLEAEGLQPPLQLRGRAFQQCCDDIFADLLFSTDIVGGHGLADDHFKALIISLAEKQEIDSIVLLQGEPFFDDRLVENRKAPGYAHGGGETRVNFLFGHKSKSFRLVRRGTYELWIDLYYTPMAIKSKECASKTESRRKRICKVFTLEMDYLHQGKEKVNENEIGKVKEKHCKPQVIKSRKSLKTGKENTS